MERRRNFFYSLLAFLIIILVFLMIINPEATFKGANYGLLTWSKILIPSLLPFFIISGILVELGVVNFLGVLLEPLMRPLFKQPGVAGFVLAMGFTSGFPMGAVLTNILYEKNLLTREEASRLIAFTNNCSPLFLLVAIPVGMFNNPNLGILLVTAHYGANLLLGILLGFKKKKENLIFSIKKTSIFKKSIKELFEYQKKNSKPFGSLLGNAINKSIQNMLLIGGFVIIFAVLIEIFKAIKIFILISLFFKEILLFIGIDPSLGEALATGLFEMTLGAKRASEINTLLLDQIMIVSLILGWSGFSIQAQVISIAGRNNLPIGHYIWGRFFQGITASILSGMLFSSFLDIVPTINLDPITIPTIGMWNYFIFNITAIFITILILLLVSTFIYLVNNK